MRSITELLEDVMEELKFHCGSSECGCCGDETKSLIKEIEEHIKTGAY